MAIEMQERLCIGKFVVVDWGTSQMRLYLCENKVCGTGISKPIILERGDGSGIANVSDAEHAFFSSAPAWLTPELPIFMSGMVGSNIGWLSTPYMSCPLPISDILLGRTCFNSRNHTLSIQHGLSCKNALQMPDFMRGEELQILGWYNSNPEQHSKGRHLLCLPGTHSKWVYVEDGIILSFTTGLSGELFDILSTHSVLTGQSSISDDYEEFERGLNMIERIGGSSFIHLLFSTRSLQLAGELGQNYSASYLSGLLIGADILAGIHGNDFVSNVVTVHVVANDKLSNWYAHGLEYVGCSAVKMSAEDACVLAYV